MTRPTTPASAAGTWRDHAACLDEDPELFFPVSQSFEAARPAQAICATCPSRQPCGEYALRTRQEAGVWGGLTETQRRSITRAANRSTRKTTAP